ncbi:hypothetical protein Asd1617_01627 [Shigella dysenteriae 1617]|uniref:Uncharacterized protein n=1 Tax=Shigella dysenteriae 1617 TaxID=754093 RepID=A0A0A6ZR98_SHIDY|nr:hypothetical protein Asd1617_01627 [Shigella dysenteriae 1617]
MKNTCSTNWKHHHFLLSEKILILFYQFVNHYTSIYIFRHSAILPDNFLVEQSVI